MRCVSVRRDRKGSGEEKQAEHSQDWRQVKNALHGKLLLLRGHYTRVEAAGLQVLNWWLDFGDGLNPGYYPA
jgi:hypothetical protein